MLKRDELSNPTSCLNRAADGEMLFVVRGHDVTFPAVVRFWADERIRVGKNLPGDPQISEALLAADQVESQHRTSDSTIEPGLTPEQLKAQLKRLFRPIREFIENRGVASLLLSDPDDAIEMFGAMRRPLPERMKSVLWHCGSIYMVEELEDQGVIDKLRLDLEQSRAALNELESRLNTPELHDFASGVVLEAQHQRHRWGSDHDAGKAPEDWFWLVGYLAGKALRAHASGDTDKALHHTISTAAALANWHAAILGLTNMRPGIDPAECGIEASL